MLIIFSHPNYISLTLIAILAPPSCIGYIGIPKIISLAKPRLFNPCLMVAMSIRQGTKIWPMLFNLVFISTIFKGLENIDKFHFLLFDNFGFLSQFICKPH